MVLEIRICIILRKALQEDGVSEKNAKAMLQMFIDAHKKEYETWLKHKLELESQIKKP